MKTLLFSMLIMPQAFAADFYSLKATDNKKKPVNFSQYEKKVVLFANTASKCGYTPQYEGLQKLADTYGKKGLVVVAQPSNSFKQELDSDKKIGEFCQTNYKVNFTLLEKASVAGKDRSPLFTYLVTNSTTPAREVSWNFEKFLVDRSGKVVARFDSATSPDDKNVIAAIEKALK